MIWNRQSPPATSGLTKRGGQGCRRYRYEASVGGRLRYCGSLSLLALFACCAPSLKAVTCTMQAEMQPADQEALLAAGNPLAAAIAGQNYDLLRASLFPAVVGDWENIRGVAEAAGPVAKGGQVQWQYAYLLDASDLKGPADTQFFCTSGDNSITVTIDLSGLLQGKYALMMGSYSGTPLAGQLALILGADPTAGGKWKLGGLFAHEGALEGHDGVWFWTHAREFAQKKSGWAAWFTYDVARWLLTPVNFLSSPNLEKLNREQMQLKGSPLDTMPLTVPTEAGKSWKVTNMRLDTTLHAADLALTYEGTGLTEPVAARAEALTVMSGLLKLHPELRDSFHGLWAYSEKDGKRIYAIELAMRDIP